MPMDVVLGRERTARSQVVKQADVVALLALRPEEFVGDTGPGKFPILRATALQPRQLAEPHDAWDRRRAAGIRRNGATLLPADGRD